MKNIPPNSEFRDVDRSINPRHYVANLDFQNTTAFAQFYKQRTFELLDLREGQRVLDIGCGIGQDALTMAELVGQTGQVVGVDFSQTMVREAQQRSQEAHLPVTFCQGDIHHLAFPDDCFDRCRSDKTFVHIADPKQALGELIRVTAPGGLLLVVDQDHEMRVIDTPYPDLTRRFLAFRNHHLPHPGIGHQLYALFRSHGLTDIIVEPVTLVHTDHAVVQSIWHFAEGIRSAQHHNVVTAEEADQWIDALEEASRKGQFFHSVTFFIVVGRKPLRTLP
jgi:ubiquinone/menaquinone biosynthesis C-methylase UbiE